MSDYLYHIMAERIPLTWTQLFKEFSVVMETKFHQYYREVPPFDSVLS
jgi:hypothetical protein